METVENKILKPKNYYVSIIITQSICVVLIALSVICIKYFFKGTYKQIKEFYKNEICSQTDINEVLKGIGENK